MRQTLPSKAVSAAQGPYVEGRDRAVETLKLQLADRFELGQHLDRGVHLAVDQDLAALRLAAQPRREIHHAADGGVVEAAFRADAAERGKAVCDADAEAELVAELFPFRCQHD